MPFTAERTFARAFLAALRGNKPLSDEVLYALTETLTRYDTTPYENRFVVGGVCEQIIGSAARALGFPVENVGAQLQGYDLSVPDDGVLSVKFQTAPVTASLRVRIANSQGAVPEWSRGTLFVQSGLGIGYSDRELTPGITMVASDKASLDCVFRPLLSLWGCALPPVSKGSWLAALPTFPADPRYFLEMNIPSRPALRSTRLVSDTVAHDIFRSGHTPLLSKHYMDSR